MKHFVFSFVILILSTFCYGQSAKEKQIRYLIDRAFKDSTRRGPTSVRFLIDILSSGDYSMSNQLFFIVYPDNEDTSKVSKQAGFIEKALRLQGAKRTFDAKEADVLINVSFARDGDRRTIYHSLKTPIYGTGNMGSFNTFTPYRYNSAAGTTSANNPNLPYYQDSFGPAGRGKYLIRSYAYNYSFSLIIEGLSKNGELLWKTIATDYRSAAITDAIMPYLCFASIGFIGTKADCSEQFRSNNPIYLKWSDGMLDNGNTILYPDYNSSSKKVEVAFIVKEENKTIVALKDSNPNLYKGALAFVEYGGDMISASYSYIEDRLPQNNYPGFTIWEFSFKVTGLNEFDLVLYKGKNKKKEIFAIRNIKLAE